MEAIYEKALSKIFDMAHAAANGGTRTAGKPTRVGDLKSVLREIRDDAREALALEVQIMTQFMGIAHGSQGKTRKLGTKKSGLAVTAVSYQGAIEVVLTHDKNTGKDMARVAFTNQHGSGSTDLIYEGPVAGKG